MADKAKNAVDLVAAVCLTTAGAVYAATASFTAETGLGLLLWGWLFVACVAGVIAVSATANGDDVDESNGEGW